MVSASDQAPGAANEGGDSLAEQALLNLVSQFARPLDCLRELVQNSIDAGSPRVEVWVRPAPEGLEIHVDDFGEGMDEDTIDDKLTALFASDKEDDLTRIGKFGVGFTSIFALRPRAVLLRTGRYGEAWELLFHADHSFDKVRLERPVTGTQITLFLEVKQPARFIQECRWILGFWCEHSDTPITFEDRSGGPASAGDPEDPFGGFSAPRPAVETVNRPLDLDGDLVVSREQRGIQVRVGLSRSPRYSFYNGGLTLVNTTDPEILGALEASLGRYSIKLKDAALEHTLTRDNIIRDGHWRAAMGVVEAAAEALVERLLRRTEAAVLAGEPLGLWHRHLRAEAPRWRTRRWWRRLTEVAIFRDCTGRPVRPAAAMAAARRHGAALVHSGGGPLAEALTDAGLLLLEDRPETRALLSALDPPLVWGRLSRPTGTTALRVRRAEEDFVLGHPLDPSALAERERALLVDCQALLSAAGWSRVLRLGELVGGGWDWRERLVLSIDARGLASRQGARWKGRSLLLNREHPVYRAWQVEAARGSEAERALAAYGLAQAILHAQGAPERALRRLLTWAAAGRA